MSVCVYMFLFMWGSVSIYRGSCLEIRGQWSVLALLSRQGLFSTMRDQLAGCPCTSASSYRAALGFQSFQCFFCLFMWALGIWTQPFQPFLHSKCLYHKIVSFYRWSGEFCCFSWLSLHFTITGNSCTDMSTSCFLLTKFFLIHLKKNVWVWISRAHNTTLQSLNSEKKIHLLVQLVFLKYDRLALWCCRGGCGCTGMQRCLCDAAVAGVAAPGCRGVPETHSHAWGGEGMGEGQVCGSSTMVTISAWSSTHALL